MTAARVALMGFGRLGRNVLRQVLTREDIDIVAVSDLGAPEALAYLLRFDTIYGRLDGIGLDGGCLTAGRHRARIVKGGRPEAMPWGDLGVDVVVEATHVFRRRADLEGHLAAGAGRVILSTPPLDAIDRILLYGVNHQDLRPGDRLVSCGSSTTQVLALMLKILHEAAGVEAAMKTTRARLHQRSEAGRRRRRQPEAVAQRGGEPHPERVLVSRRGGDDPPGAEGAR